MIGKRPLIQPHFDRIRLGYMLLVAVFTAVCFAGIYYELAKHSHHSGLACGDKPCQQSFLTALYFSVVTETTLGYGDVVPVGFARGCACLQVVLGLIIAGAVVTKITSQERGELNRIAQELEGHWVEFIEMKDSNNMVSFSVFFRVGDRIIYEGENFDEDGEACGYFHGTLMSGDKDSYRFQYSNRETHKKEGSLTEGYCNITFYSEKRRWTTFCGDIRDFVDKANYEQTGWAATSDECKIIDGPSDDKRRKLAQDSFKRGEDLSRSIRKRNPA